MVVAFHAGLPVPGGFIGVDVFFVISGFVITAMLHREWSGTGRLNLRQFYWRRFKRLMPALALMISVVMVASALVLSPLGPQQVAALTAISAMLIVANFSIARTTGGYFGAPAETNPLLNTWSLSVEEQFYLFFPAVIAIGWYMARRSRLMRLSPFAIIGGIAIVSFGLALMGSAGLDFRGSATILGFFSPFTRAWEFAAGALLAVALARRARMSPRLLAPIGILGLLLLAVGLWTISDTTPFPGLWTLIPVTGTLLLLLAGTDSSVLTSRILSTRPMTKVGDWSYSIYLWHWPFIVLTAYVWPETASAVIVAALVSFVPAVASFRWVEQPIRTGRWSSSRGRALLVVSVVGIPIGAASMTWALGESARDSPALAPFVEATEQVHIGWRCMDPFTMTNSLETSFEPTDCTWGAERSGRPIYLVGDSNAGQFSEAVLGAAKVLQRPASITAAAGCPFLSVFRQQGTGLGLADDRCREWVRDNLDALSRSTPGTVVIANSDVYFWDDYYAVGLDGEVPSTARTAKAAAYEVGIRRTVRTLREAGHDVLLVQPLPRFDIDPYVWSPRECKEDAVIEGRCRVDMPLAFADGLQGELRTRLESVASDEGAHVLDLRSLVCPGTSCSPNSQEGFLYMDPWHISVAVSNGLASDFTTAIRSSSESPPSCPFPVSTTPCLTTSTKQR